MIKPTINEREYMQVFLNQPLKQLLLILITAVTTIFASTASAVNFKARVGYGLGSYEFTGGDSFYSSEGDFDLPEFGLVLFSDSGFYTDLSLGSASGGEAEFDGRFNTELEHSTATITLGILGANGGATFGGYTVSSTKFEGIAGKLEISTAGFFLGYGAVLQTGSGSIGLNGAVSLIAGEWEYLGVGAAEADYGVGYSVGANYTHSLSESASVAIVLKHRSYFLEFVDDEGYLEDELQESINSAGLTFGYSF